jgi:hypothetical protein
VFQSWVEVRGILLIIKKNYMMSSMMREKVKVKDDDKSEGLRL